MTLLSESSSAIALVTGWLEGLGWEPSTLTQLGAGSCGALVSEGILHHLGVYGVGRG